MLGFKYKKKTGNWIKKIYTIKWCYFCFSCKNGSNKEVEYNNNN